MPSVLSALGELVRAVREVAAAIGRERDREREDPAVNAQLVQLSGTLAELVRRVDEMERTRALWEANTEASLIRALEDHRAARRSEERERMGRKKRARDEDEEGTLAFADPEAAGSIGPAAGVPAVPAPVANGARDRGAAARAAKWGWVS
jgi:hypothetical protein